MLTTAVGKGSVQSVVGAVGLTPYGICHLEEKELAVQLIGDQRISVIYAQGALVIFWCCWCQHLKLVAERGDT